MNNDVPDRNYASIPTSICDHKGGKSAQPGVDMVKTSQNDVPDTQSQTFWGVLLSLYVFVMLLTMLKDWWFPAKVPDVLFYIFVPALSILGGVLSMDVMATISKQTTPFLSLLAISLGVNTIMQVVENVMKLVYYLLCEYPGYLYIVVVIPLGFLLIVCGLIRWGKVKRWIAVTLASVDFIGSMLILLLLVDVLGLTTPGS